MRVIFETDDKRFRIIERADLDADMDYLKGEMFTPELHPDIPLEQLEREERDFEEFVEREGVYGYVLERWNPTPGVGYEHVDSCWGFVGQYSPDDRSGMFNHYIVDEMKAAIVNMQAGRSSGTGA